LDPLGDGVVRILDRGAHGDSASPRDEVDSRGPGRARRPLVRLSWPSLSRLRCTVLQRVHFVGHGQLVRAQPFYSKKITNGQK
jgi:hypothetical protein